MWRSLPVLVALALTVALPFVFRPRQDLLAAADDTVTIVTPHNEAIRHEFATAFADHYKNTTGRTVRIDWRMPGGTSEIAVFLASEFEAAFRKLWTSEIGREWNLEVAGAYASRRIDPSEPGPAGDARRAFLNSDAGVGIDLFFGGGSFDFARQAEAGRLVDCGVRERLPHLFDVGGIPQSLGGEPFYDEDGRWYGTCLSAFGICYNADALARLGMERAPTAWADLGDTRLRGEIALADPTKSGSIAKAFEMLIQHHMHQRRAEGFSGQDAVERGWEDGLRTIQRLAANARYFTDAASKIVIDVALGDAAAGMCIDFYGRQQAEAVSGPDGKSRMLYVTPEGGSSIGVDPIGLLRGAPNRDVALKFIDFVLSEEGQRLWNQKPGTPGGPQRHALRRLPVLPSLYSEAERAWRSDPDVRPYAPGSAMDYEPDWTGPLFGPIRFIVKVMALDAHEELRAAWEAMESRGFPPEALEIFEDVSRVNYQTALGELRERLGSADKIVEVRLAKELSEHFRSQYRRAEEIALQLTPAPVR